MIHNTWLNKRVEKARGPPKSLLKKQKELCQATAKGQWQGKQKGRAKDKRRKAIAAR